MENLEYAKELKQIAEETNTLLWEKCKDSPTAFATVLSMLSGGLLSNVPPALRETYMELFNSSVITFAKAIEAGIKKKEKGAA